MPDDSNLVIAISSTALFDMRDSHEVFEKEGVDGFAEYQLSLIHI